MAGEGAHAPMGCIRRSGFQGRIQNLLLQFGRQHPARAFAFLSLPKRLDAAAPKRRPRGNHGGTGQAGLLCYGIVGYASGCQQDHLALPRHRLRCSAGPNQRFQYKPLRRINSKRGRRSEHARLDHESAVLSIIMTDRTPEAHATSSQPTWDRAAAANRRFAERLAASAGGVGQVYDDQSTVFGSIVKEYLLAWAALLEVGEPAYALANTVEVPLLHLDHGRRIGIRFQSWVRLLRTQLHLQNRRRSFSGSSSLETR